MNYKNLGTPYKTDSLTLYNCDCMELLKQTPDNYYDICVVDPPYGIDAASDTRGGQKHGKAATASKTYGKKTWDKYTPDIDYFIEIQRVSKNQIIWGANHMMDKIRMCSPSWIVWDKQNGDNGYADAELAYTSHKKACRIFKFRWQGMLQGDMKNKESRIHPTQKPVKLYDWIFANYAEKGMKILDTHLGSMSSAISAHYAGMHLTGSELDKDYFDAGCARVHRETSQTTLNL
jgi:site-specific DNA-methyltransferase (adenine-specific)